MLSVDLPLCVHPIHSTPYLNHSSPSPIPSTPSPPPRIHPLDSKEQWYQTDYTLTALDPSSMAAWANPPTIDPALKLPEPNTLIATDFALRGLAEGSAAVETGEWVGGRVGG